MKLVLMKDEIRYMIFEESSGKNVDQRVIL